MIVAELGVLRVCFLEGVGLVLSSMVLYKPEASTSLIDRPKSSPAARHPVLSSACTADCGFPPVSLFATRNGVLQGIRGEHNDSVGHQKCWLSPRTHQQCVIHAPTHLPENITLAGQHQARPLTFFKPPPSTEVNRTCRCRRRTKLAHASTITEPQDETSASEPTADA